MFPKIIKLILWVILLKIDTIPTIITLVIDMIDKIFLKTVGNMSIEK